MPSTTLQDVVSDSERFEMFVGVYYHNETKQWFETETNNMIEDTKWQKDFDGLVVDLFFQ